MAVKKGGLVVRSKERAVLPALVQIATVGGWEEGGSSEDSGEAAAMAACAAAAQALLLEVCTDPAYGLAPAAAQGAWDDAVGEDEEKLHFYCQ
jgi:hypothetical protein